MLSILAGMLIAMSGIAYLTVGGPIGASLFSLGLLTILHFKLELFTGKAGLLATNQIKPLKLLMIWCGNLLGCVLMAGLFLLIPPGQNLVAPAAAITLIRITNSWFTNILLGFYCGILMYIAVAHYESKPWVTAMCVISFILVGANHCIADMFYLSLAFLPSSAIPIIGALIFTTLGNIIGCNFIPLGLRLYHYFQSRRK